MPSDAYAVMNLLKAHLQSRLDADYSSDFATFGGAKVFLLDDEASARGSNEYSYVGPPYIVFDEPSEEDKDDWGRGARTVTIPLDVVATEFSGAAIGASNPVGSDTLLSKAFLEIVREDYAALRSLGFYEPVARKRNGDNRDGTHINPHEFKCVIIP